MASGQVTVRGRFKPGTIVRLYEASGPHQLRPEGEPVAESEVQEDDNGVSYVSFGGLQANARYFVSGLIDGSPVDLRATGREESEDVEQPAVQRDRVRMADGSWEDERPEGRDTPSGEVWPAPAQSQAGDVQQRSATWRGSAHPVDPDELTPYRSQDDVPEGTPQSSDTRRREIDDGVFVGGGGAAAVVAVGPQHQSDVPEGTPQRSDTPAGTAFVVPQGDAIEVQREKESAIGKEMRGRPTRVSSEPIQGAEPPKGASQEESEERTREIAEIEGRTIPVVDEEGEGLDAQGQPVYADAAQAAGVEPADSPAEPVKKPRGKKKD